MSTLAWILLLIVAVVVVAAAAWWFGSRRRSERLRDRFGSEYDRTVESAGGRSRAEADLEARQERVESLQIRPLDPSERDRFRERWRVVQALFVDDPGSALGEADTLIGDVMRARGYPVGDFEQRAADISVDHPDVVEHYRTAHAIAVQNRNGPADTEELRQAMVHDRALVVELLDLPADDAAGATRSTASDATTDRTGTATDGAGADSATATAVPPKTAPADSTDRPITTTRNVPRRT